MITGLKIKPLFRISDTMISAPTAMPSADNCSPYLSHKHTLSLPPNWNTIWASAILIDLSKHLLPLTLKSLLFVG